MCRLMAYMGPPVLVADVVLWPDRSILKQSYDARERKMDASLPQHLVRCRCLHLNDSFKMPESLRLVCPNLQAYGNLNGDGFGIGWFSQHQECKPTDPSPCVFTSVTPAWYTLQHPALIICVCVPSLSCSVLMVCLVAFAATCTCRVCQT